MPRVHPWELMEIDLWTHSRCYHAHYNDFFLGCVLFLHGPGCPRRPYKSFNLTHCPIFVLYLDEEGICPIFSLKMSYKSYNLGVLSYNYFQIHVQPAYRQVQAKIFAAARQTHTVNHNVLNSGQSLDIFGCWNFRRYAAIPDSNIVHKRIQLSEPKKCIRVC